MPESHTANNLSKALCSGWLDWALDENKLLYHHTGQHCGCSEATKLALAKLLWPQSPSHRHQRREQQKRTHRQGSRPMWNPGGHFFADLAKKRGPY